MATAKQLAWRKKFAAMAKAGTLKKKSRRNPAMKKTAPAKRAVSRVVSRANPVKRKVAVKSTASNPRKSSTLYVVYAATLDGKPKYDIAKFREKKLAMQYAKAYSNTYNVPVLVQGKAL